MKTYFFTGRDTTLELSPGRSIRLTKRGQSVELTDEEAVRHVGEAPLVPEDQWKIAAAAELAAGKKEK